jgi:hypothetical protein
MVSPFDIPADKPDATTPAAGLPCPHGPAAASLRGNDSALAGRCVR